MKVFITARGQKKLERIWFYLQEVLGEQAAQSFKIKVSKFLKVLEHLPEIGSVEVPDKQIRSFSITTKTKVFYRIKEDKIVVLTFFDVRQNPNKKLKR